MMKRQGLVITAWGLSGDRGPTFGVDGLPLVGVVFFPSSSLVRVVLFPSYAHNTSRRYSTHFPFRSSSLVFSAAFRVLIVTSTFPLDCG